jgi:GNAT superfamily N-acetyltransferase
MTTRRAPTLRPPTTVDLPVIAAILAANDEAVDWPDRPGWPYLDHLLVRGRVLVAEIDDAVVGFGATISLDPSATRFLTDLFVDPDRHGGGAGRSLLDALLEDAMPRMTFSSADPRAQGSYIRAGMRPWWPLLYLSGEATVAGRPAAGLAAAETQSWRPASVREASERSLAWTGIDREADFAHYARLPEAAGFAVVDDGEVAGIGWARRARRAPGRCLEHLSIAPDADPARVALAAWAAAAPDGGMVSGCVPGPHPVVATLLERGVRIVDRDQWCASDPDLVDPVRLLPNPSFL